MTFQEKLVRLRKIRGLTQDEFASAVGVSRQAVYKWESGQSYPEVAKLLEIKMLFGISIDDLLDDTYEVVMPEKKKRKKISRAVAEGLDDKIRARMDEASSLEIAESLSRAGGDGNGAVAAESPAENTAPVSGAPESAGEETAPESAPVCAGAETVASVAQAEEGEAARMTAASEEKDPAAVESDAPQTAAAAETPAPVYQNPAEKEQPQATQEEENGKKRGFFGRLFGRK